MAKKESLTKAEKREREQLNKKNKKKVKEDSKPEKFQKHIEVRPRTQVQSEYLHEIQSKDIVFAFGPAGTGKSFIPLAYAAKQLVEERSIDKIIITRPLVESGKEIGALPGELEDKLWPFFQAPRNILDELLGESFVEYLLKVKSISFVPLEFLRGSTFKNSFIVLDEAQNTNKEQMQLFLSRVGGGSKMILNGDTEQTDLGNKEIDGMTDGIYKLRDIPEVGIVQFEDEDIVRSRIAKKVIQAYRK